MPRRSRERSKRDKVLAVGGSALLIALLAVGTVVVARGSGPGPLPPATGGEPATPAAAGGGGIGGGSAAPPSLPGAQTWSNGASSYVFGTNDGIDYAEPAFSSVTGPSSPQAMVKQGGLTLDRVWGWDDMSTATITQKVSAANNSGMTCYFMLGAINDLAWMERTVDLVEPMGCHLFEFGNEPDQYNSAAGQSIAKYTTMWNTDIPQLRALSVCSAAHACLFGGPAVAYPTSADSSVGNYPSDLAHFLGQSAAAGVRADFVSYHDYPCYGYTDQSACLTHTTQAFAQDQDEVLGWEQQYYGKIVPTGISEYNFDAGSSTLSNWGGDSRFMYDWTRTAIEAFVANHFSFAMQFTSLNDSGYGKLDMFSDSAPYEPKAQFYGIVSSVEKYGGPSTLAVPSPLP